MQISFTKMPAVLTALVAAALVGMTTGAPVSGDVVPRTITPGIQMWSGPDFSGTFYHYTGPEIKFDTCCKHDVDILERDGMPRGQPLISGR